METDKCLICGEPLANGRHLRKHKISKEVYLRMYEDPDHGFCPICGKMRPFINGKLKKCDCKKRLYYYLLSGSSDFMMIEMYKDEVTCRSSYLTSTSPIKYFLAHGSKLLAEELGMNKVAGTYDGYLQGGKEISDLVRTVVSKFYVLIHVYNMKDAVVVVTNGRSLPGDLLFTRSIPRSLLYPGLLKVGFIRDSKEENTYYSFDESISNILRTYEFI